MPKLLIFSIFLDEKKRFWLICGHFYIKLLLSTFLLFIFVFLSFIVFLIGEVKLLLLLLQLDDELIKLRLPDGLLNVDVL